MKCSNNFQIILLYDFIDIQKLDINLDKIKEITKKELNKNENKMEESLQNYGNILFQLIYFDANKHHEDLKNSKKRLKKRIMLL